MSTFDYLTPAEAVTAAQTDAPDYKRITGLRGVDADRIPNLIPEEPWRAHGHLDKFKEIARVEWAQDADPGTAEVFYADGSTDLVRRGDLLCVERPITRAEADTPEGPFDVRVFSNAPEFKPRGGVVSITEVATWLEAQEIVKRESAKEGYSAGVYYPGTARPVTR